MKSNLNIRFPFLSFVLIALLVYRPGIVNAQKDTTKVAAAEFEKLSPSITFTALQKGDNTIDLKADMKAKYKGNFIKLPHLKVIFTVAADTTEKELGSLITDRRGMGTYNFKADELVADKEGKVTIKASFAGNQWMEAADADLSFKRARLIMEPVKGDSSYSVNLKLFDLSTGEEKPVADADLGIYVKRTFFPLKVGEGKTDAEGAASIDVPLNLPGDPVGNITLLAKVNDNETYGNLETAAVEKWGKPISNAKMELPRALWSSHPPTWMLITFIVLMTTVWGHYIVIIYELFRLRKEEPEKAPELPA